MHRVSATLSFSLIFVEISRTWTPVKTLTTLLQYFEYYRNTLKTTYSHCSVILATNFLTVVPPNIISQPSPRFFYSYHGVYVFSCRAIPEFMLHLKSTTTLQPLTLLATMPFHLGIFRTQFCDVQSSSMATRTTNRELINKVVSQLDRVKVGFAKSCCRTLFRKDNPKT